MALRASHAPFRDAWINGTKTYDATADALLAGLGLIREGAPEAMKGFAALALGATAAKNLDTRTGELMTVTISIAVRCGPCVAHHTRAAVKHRATPQAAIETAATAV